MNQGAQKVMHCPCGRDRVLASGMCATCYELWRQDDERFGGLREAVLERDGHSCRVCGASGWREALHRCASPCSRQIPSPPDNCALPSVPAKVHRTRVVLSLMPPLLVTLWREQHPDGHEQTQIDFRTSSPAAIPVVLFT